MRRWVVLGAVFAVLAVSGCVPEERIPTLPPTPTVTPLFATEEEALAAAETAYVAYQAAIDRALQVLETDGLENVATGIALENALMSVAEYVESGQRQEGPTSVSDVVPVDLSPLLSGEDEAGQIYACLDLSLTHVVNSDGTISTSSQMTFPMLVEIVLIDSVLLVADEQVWTGDDFC